MIPVQYRTADLYYPSNTYKNAGMHMHNYDSPPMTPEIEALLCKVRRATGELRIARQFTAIADTGLQGIVASWAIYSLESPLLLLHIHLPK